MRANPTPQALGAPQGIRHAPCRILVVDREADLRQLYTDALASPGCKVDVAENVPTAWEALQARRYHLLVTENDPPDLTGDELMRKLRGANMELPVVMAARGWPMHEPALNPSLPFAATLRKPFVLEALLEIVNNALRSDVPMRKYASRRSRRPNPARVAPTRSATPDENTSKEQAIGVR